MITRILSILILISLTNIVFGQQPTVKELIEKTSCKSFSCFNDFIISKGFSFGSALNSKESDGTEFTNYYFDSDYSVSIPSSDSYVNWSTKNYATYTIRANKSTSVRILTPDKKYYQSITNQLSKLGFVNDSSGSTNNGGVETIYKSKIIKNIIVLITIDTSYGSPKYTQYAIEIKR